MASAAPSQSATQRPMPGRWTRLFPCVCLPEPQHSSPASNRGATASGVGASGRCEDASASSPQPPPECIVRFLVIGSGVIVENFIAAGERVPGFELAGVYSRTEGRAREFAGKFASRWPQCEAFWDLQAAARSDRIDAVYVASPTSEHARHCLLFMPFGKHIFCEKPACSNTRELEEVLACAKRHKVAFMEGMRTMQSPNFAAFTKQVAEIGRPRHFVGTACQLSSRWPAYLRGERPNAFLRELSNGALMDLGCYAVHTCVALLGPPESVNYTAVMLETGVDVSGTLVLTYKDTTATLLLSKASQGYTRSEVQGERGTVSVDSLLEFTDVWLHAPGAKQPQVVSAPPDGGPADLMTRGSTRWAGQMKHEVRSFINLIAKGVQEDSVVSWAQSRAAMAVLDAARQSAGIRFPADEAQGPVAAGR
eukprot:TRINITY_DN1228_c0_g1_i1.p1 TRINITY_DN1228_c0_g1~~TRINITY_DN1228_c0_g1_i1.p1  ORF type:complete len:477 (+),score=85.03 TRINITY_DN1228_c0_g1_i1:165-1433(+)